MLGGLAAFTAGFAVAGVLVALRQGGSPPYLAAVGVGLAGVGLLGVHYQRIAVQLPPGRLWSRPVLTAVATSARLPAQPVIAVLYGLGLVGLAGNLLVPFLRR